LATYVTDFEQLREVDPPSPRRRVTRILQRFHRSAVNQSEWLIREMDATEVPGAKGPRCLVCECAVDGVVRRLWQYPREWHELPDDELRKLCEGHDGSMM